MSGTWNGLGAELGAAFRQIPSGCERNERVGATHYVIWVAIINSVKKIKSIYGAEIPVIPLMPVHKEVITMPPKAPHPCAYPRCPNLTTERYCPDHKTIASREYNQSNRPTDRKLYGRQWVAIRNLYIQKHPLCELCLEAGRYVPATEVHHKLPLDKGGSNDESNLQALCKPCHSAITISETNREGRS